MPRAASGDVSKTTRFTVYALLAAFLICGFAGIEAWPLSGWRFFVHTRSPFQRTWSAVVAAPGDPPERVSFSSFPAAFHDFAAVMQHFASLGPAARRRVCLSWARVAGHGEEATTLFLYAVTWDVSDRGGSRRDPVIRRSLVTQCTLLRPQTLDVGDSARGRAEHAVR